MPFCLLSQTTQTRAVNITHGAKHPKLRCSWNANMVVLNFPATTAPSWVEPATVSLSSEVNSWWNVTAGLVFAQLPRHRGSYRTVKVIENWLVTRSACTQQQAVSCMSFNSYNEPQLNTEGVRFPLWGCHLQSHTIPSPTEHIHTQWILHAQRFLITREALGKFSFF